MHQQRWNICGKLNIQLLETWLLKLHKKHKNTKCILTIAELNTWWGIIKTLLVLNYINVDMLYN